MDWTQAALDALAAEVPLAEAAPALAIRADGDRMQMDLDGVVGWDITANGVRRALAEAGGRPLTVRVNSYGGSVFEGFAIHNQLARYKGEVTILVDAVAASAASVIAMAGARIQMPRNAFLMIHNAWTLAMGDHREMARTATLLERISSAVAALYAARTGQDRDAMQSMMDAETWLGAEDALAEGFATEIEGEAQARVPQGRSAEILAAYRRPPQALRSLLPAPAALAALNPRAQPVQQEARMSVATPTTPGQPTSPAPANPAPAAAPTTPQPQAATLVQLQELASRSRGALNAEWVLSQATAGATLDQARDAAISAMADAQPQRGPVATLVTDERDTFRMRAAGALYAHLAQQAPSAEGREFYGLGLQGLLKECLNASGVSGAYRLSGEALYDRFRQEHTTSDFPLILRDAANKRLMTRFESYPATWRGWTEEFDVNDFKSINVVDIGRFPKLSPKPESASVRYGAVTEDGFTYSISTKSSGVELSREAIINDDLNAFTRMLNDAASAGYESLADAVFAQLTTNPVMQDGKTLFHADHKNLAAGADLTEASLGLAEQLLLEQTDLSGRVLAPPTRLLLLVSAARHIQARKLATVITAPDSQQNVAVYGGRITPVVEPRLAATNSPWYLVTPDRPTIEVAYLRGRRAPQLSSMENFDTLGMKYRLIFDFAAKASSWRGMVKNPGVAPTP
ncbi:head maturation protease, ClpP-related [Pseudoroseomonas cervicalis]|uniref:head maturation protease, ClpP-related n=1 Tax=Teichococcus cervicalis TaxID=204525 RepID=UPI00277DAB15|nr:head maturation protease, ClpP-related [Pseudoroseomonas cervicalis]MDQ1079700.1 ATP-dependent protease ClpP protease subunit [Pseudoroseomonas cervicalis]